MFLMLDLKSIKENLLQFNLRPLI